MKQTLLFLLVIISLVVLTSCKKQAYIILSTTTSTDHSGLLEYLLPYFEDDSGIEVRVISRGTGAALEMGRQGEADILLVHDVERELEFMNDGYGTLRSEVMFNDFVLVGTRELSDVTLEDILTTIKEDELPFISRDDQSGTHAKELSLWASFDIEPSGDWYIKSGQGMGGTLTMANEEEAYTLSDRATFYKTNNISDLKIIFEDKVTLRNQYGVILVNPELHKRINSDGAIKFYDWLLSSEAQELINNFGKDEFEEPLFTANAPKE